MLIKSTPFQNSNNTILYKISPKQIEYYRTYINKKLVNPKYNKYKYTSSVFFQDNDMQNINNIQNTSHMQ